MRLLDMGEDPSIAQTDNIPKDHKINGTVLAKLDRENRVYRNFEKVLFDKSALLSNEFGKKAPIPQDVKDAYTQFAYSRYKKEFTKLGISEPKIELKNKGKPYAIVSKTDAHVYMFDALHNLVARKAALLGKDTRKSDRGNTPYDVGTFKDLKQIPDSTPKGLYTIGNKGYVDGDIGHYMTLIPKDGQIKYTMTAGKLDRSIGFHKIYAPEKETRNAAIRSDKVRDKFITNGCINIDTGTYVELYTHLPEGSAVYVTE